MRVRMVRPADWTEDRVRPRPGIWPRPANPSAYSLYRLYDVDNVLLYVGIADQPQWRVEHHRRRSWGDEIALVVIEWLPSEAAARDAEKAAIRAERPLHNRLRYSRSEA